MHRPPSVRVCSEQWSGRWLMPREYGGKTHVYNTTPFSVILFHTKNTAYPWNWSLFFILKYLLIPQGVDLTGPKKRNARLRLYGFMMADFSEEQKIQVTAKIVQDMLSYAVDYLRSNNRYSLPAAIFSLWLLSYLLSSSLHFSPSHLIPYLLFSTLSSQLAPSLLSQQWRCRIRRTVTIRRSFKGRVPSALLTSS